MWKYPAGVNVIAEYWPASVDIQVVSDFSTDSFASIFEFDLEWSDTLDSGVSSAISADDGLRIGADVLGRLTRLQQ